MKEQPSIKKGIGVGLMLLLAVALDVACAWLGYQILRVLSIVIGVVVGIAVWLWSDFATGFFCGFVAWIIVRFSLHLVAFVLDLVFGMIERKQEVAAASDESVGPAR